VKHLTTIAAAGIVAASILPAAAADITGAGSTFVYPVLAKWAAVYSQKTGANLNYQSIGSGGRHQADYRQNGNFRRHRYAADAGGRRQE